MIYCNIAILQCCKILNIKNMTKEKILNHLENNLDDFMSVLTRDFKLICVGGDYDYKDECLTISFYDFKKAFGFKPINIKYYKSFRCYHESDCCGCISSISIYIQKCTQNEYVTIFLHSNFNY